MISRRIASWPERALLEERGINSLSPKLSARWCSPVCPQELGLSHLGIPSCVIHTHICAPSVYRCIFECPLFKSTKIYFKARFSLLLYIHVLHPHTLLHTTFQWEQFGKVASDTYWGRAVYFNRMNDSLSSTSRKRCLQDCDSEAAPSPKQTSSSSDACTELSALEDTDAAVKLQKIAEAMRTIIEVGHCPIIR